jgi:hypothetical protein
MSPKQLIERKVSENDLALSKARGVVDNQIDTLTTILQQNRLLNEHDIEFICQSFADIITSMSYVNSVSKAKNQFESLLLSFD